MAKSKRVIQFGFAIFFALILLFLFVFYPRTPIITGFAAKAVCSCTFISDRAQNSIEDQDIGFLPINLAKTIINKKDKSVSATVFGLRKRTAFFVKGRGCILDNDNVKANNKKYPLPSRTFSNTESYWPNGNTVKDTILRNLDYIQLSKGLIAFFDPLGEKQVLKTRSVLVAHKGHIIGEKYAQGFDHTTPMLGWSMTKSIVNTLVGILVKNKNLDIHQSAPIEAWNNDDRSKITIHDLLQMNSGLQWNEDYNTMSDVTRMLFQAQDVSQNLKVKDIISPPQKRFYYSSGTSNLLTNIVRKQFSQHTEFINFPYHSLFDKLHMNSMVMEMDLSGNYIGSSYSFANTRDWAKFGQLYLQDGIWNGNRILPEGWVKYSTTPNGTSNGEYGAHFWLNAGGVYPDIPRDLFSANGYQGQKVIIIPSMDLVIVRTGYGSLNDEQINQLLLGIIKAFK